MTTDEFRTALAAHPDLALAFDRGFDPGGGPVLPGYHVTEFKSATVRAVDCGGRATSWSELILQVVPPARPEANATTVRKFLRIWQRVERAAPVDARATVRIETPTPDGVAVGYLVERVEATADALTVHLAPPAVACKGVDRSVGDIPVRATTTADALPVVGCCGPASAEGNANAGARRG